MNASPRSGGSYEASPATPCDLCHIPGESIQGRVSSGRGRDRLRRHQQSVAVPGPGDEPRPLQLVEGSRHRLPRRADHLREQQVTDREVDPHTVAGDSAVAARQLQQLSPHPHDVPRAGEVAQVLLLLAERRRQVLDQRPGRARQRHQLRGGERRERGQARFHEAGQHLLLRRGGRIRRPGPASQVTIDRDDCSKLARRTTNPRSTTRSGGGVERAREVGLAGRDLDRRAAGENLGRQVRVRRWDRVEEAARCGHLCRCHLTVGVRSRAVLTWQASKLAARASSSRHELRRPGRPRAARRARAAAGDDELLVAVEAVGVNYRDVYEREARRATGGKLPLVGAARGRRHRVAGPSEGDRVAWVAAPGSYAERVAVPARAGGPGAGRDVSSDSPPPCCCRA